MRWCPSSCQPPWFGLRRCPHHGHPVQPMPERVPVVPHFRQSLVELHDVLDLLEASGAETRLEELERQVSLAGRHLVEPDTLTGHAGTIVPPPPFGVVQPKHGSPTLFFAEAVDKRFGRGAHRFGRHAGRANLEQAGNDAAVCRDPPEGIVHTPVLFFPQPLSAIRDLRQGQNRGAGETPKDCCRLLHGSPHGSFLEQDSHSIVRAPGPKVKAQWTDRASRPAFSPPVATYEHALNSKPGMVMGKRARIPQRSSPSRVTTPAPPHPSP